MGERVVNDIFKNDFAVAVKLIREARNKVYHYANKQLVTLYWEFGRFVSQKVMESDWGKGVVQQLADYIMQEEPGLKGFTPRNIWRMKQFYETYGKDEKLTPLVSELDWTKNLIIMSRCKSIEEREFYLRLCADNSYSKRELDRQISSGIYERSQPLLPKMTPVVTELYSAAGKVFRDKYVLEFLNLPKQHDENDLRRALVAHLKDFVLEFGRDFSFIGEEYRLQVGNSDFFADLLFFHRELQCLVVFELKVDKFKPEYLGKLEFYLEALDRNVRKPHEKPSIGVLLCKDKDDEVVEYALSRSTSPSVISLYETKLIPKQLLRDKLHEFALIEENLVENDENLDE